MLQFSILGLPCKSLLCHPPRALINYSVLRPFKSTWGLPGWVALYPTTSPYPRYTWGHTPPPGSLSLANTNGPSFLSLCSLLTANWESYSVPRTPRPGTHWVLPFPTTSPLLSRWQTRSGFPAARASKPACLPDASHLLKWSCGKKNKTLNYY